MKKWEQPQLGELAMEETHEVTCYCEAGEALAASTGERHHGGGHPHRPPHQGGPCPDEPKPPCGQQS